jgi:hypothetical protein
MMKLKNKLEKKNLESTRLTRNPDYEFGITL